jgi:polyisoprenoid-binding protein YceI
VGPRPFQKYSRHPIFDPANPGATSVEVTIDANGIWSGEPDRDAHLRSADFLDAENHSQILFKGNEVALIGANDATLIGALTIRGVTRRVALSVRYLGQWQTPWWEGGIDRGPKTRAGFIATTQSIGSISASAGTPLWKSTGSLSAIQLKSRSMLKQS